jgi:hypothetical protein
MERLRVLFREIGRKARFRRRFGRCGPTAAEREHQADIGHQLAGVQRDRQTLIFKGRALSRHHVKKGGRSVAVEV